ncbi:hypothetical protein BD770DRAFT_439539 [Pilaira anomala]|nr:hypothetical protein BD770DRAFT_439539 [Pilaira anomala]
MSCYLEKNIWDTTTEAEEKRERIVVCLDSIYKLKKRDYDVLLLDEGTFVQYHFVSEWPYGTKSDILYAPAIVSASFPPILVEIQHTIDQRRTIHISEDPSTGYDQDLKRFWGRILEDFNKYKLATFEERS